MTDTNNPTTLEDVRERYATAATDVATSCCSTDCCAEGSASLGSSLYSTEDIATLPKTAADASLGCGNPTAIAELREGETVLDLGSGGGIDVLLSAKRVGVSGFVYGLDMTDEMLDLARKNQTEAGATNVEFLKGVIEEIPLADNTVDVVISNCVINLSLDKPTVLAEMARVLKPRGRIGLTDIVAENHLSPEARRERGGWVGCIAGALSFGEFEQGLRDAGFSDVSLTPTHEVADGLQSAIIRATKA